MEQVNAIQEIPQKVEDDMVKQLLFEQYTKDHQALAFTINKIPFPPELKKNIVLFLDTSYIWGEKAFSFMNFNQPVPQEIAFGEPHPDVKLEVIESSEKLADEPIDAA